MMTAEEHKLMIGMFTTQILALKSLVTALKSHDVLESDDFEAYFQLAKSEELSESDVSKAVGRIYQHIARDCGVKIQLLGI